MTKILQVLYTISRAWVHENKAFWNWSRNVKCILYQKTMTLASKKFTIYHSLYRSDVTPSTYAQVSKGHSVSTNSAVNSQSIILIVLISIDCQTEVLFLKYKCRYTAWKHVENSFFSNLSTLNVRSPYMYIGNLIKYQRIHKIQNAINSQARCLVYSTVLNFWSVHKSAKKDN